MLVIIWYMGMQIKCYFFVSFRDWENQSAFFGFISNHNRARPTWYSLKLFVCGVSQEIGHRVFTEVLSSTLHLTQIFHSWNCNRYLILFNATYKIPLLITCWFHCLASSLQVALMLITLDNVYNMWKYFSSLRRCAAVSVLNIIYL